MNETWVRSPIIEDGYYDLHNLRPDIYFSVPQQRGVNKVKLVYGGKEIILTETLSKGFTQSVTLEFNGETKQYKRVYDAEVEANKLLRS